MGLRGVTAIALLAFPVACGGRVVEENTPDQPSTPTDVMSSQDASTPAKNSSGAGGSSKDDFNGTVALPSCVMGKRAADMDQSTLGKTCQYLYAGRCYTTKVKACACACPNKPNTVCSSGFPSLEGTTEVFCG